MAETDSKKMEQIERFGTGDIRKIMREFAIPAIIGIIVNALYNIIDTIVLGHVVGELGLAATTVATPMMTLMMALSMLIGVGGNSLTALKFGEGKKEEAEKVLGNAATMMVIMGIIVGVAGNIFIDPLLWASGVTDASYEMSRQFISIILMGFIFQSVGFGLNNFIRTAGAPGRALMTMIVGAVACTVFNILFVVVFGWGVRGSALATIVGQAISAATVVQYFLSKKAPFGFKRANFKLDLLLDKQILVLGIAPMLLQLAGAVVNVVFNHLCVKYGALSVIGSEGALASMGVTFKIAMVSMMPAIGITQAAQPLLGYNYGAQIWPRVRETFKVAMIWATVICTATFVIVQLFPGPIMSIFGIEEKLYDFSEVAVRICTVMFPIIGMQMVGSNYFQATGQPMKATLLTMTRQLLYLIPLFFIMPEFFINVLGVDGMFGLCASMPASDLLAFITTIIFDKREMNRIRALEAEAGA